MNLNKVHIPKFVQNIAGEDFDTVDSQKEMFKCLYNEIYKKGKSNEFMKVLEKADQNNDGRLESMQLGFFVKYITGGDLSPFSNEQIEKFVRALPRVGGNKILYVDFLDQITQVGNRNHNPFKSLIKKLDYFIESNEITILELLRRLDPINGENEGAEVDRFAKFLKDKIEKNKDIANLVSYTRMMDIDKDGRICQDDL